MSHNVESSRAITPKLITSVYEYLQNLPKSSTGDDFIYRGHKRASFHLIPSLFRTSPKPDWVSYGNSLIQEFLRNAGRYIDTITTDAWAIKALAQHHGIPTDLLDWSLNPLVALFFSVENLEPKSDEEEAHVWAIEGSPCIRDSHPEFETRYHISPNGSYFIPPVINDRMAAQQGCFTQIHMSLYYPENGQPCEPLYRRMASPPTVYRIEHKNRVKIQKELNELGMNYNTVYPDLEGLGKHITWKAKLETGSP